MKQKLSEKRLRAADKHEKQLQDVSEYSDRYQKHPSESYLKRNASACPKDLSTSLYDLNAKLNDIPRARTTTSTSVRLPQTKDVMENVYENMLVKSKKAPRTFYYLGKIPTNGALDVYSMNDFETLTPVYAPTIAKAISADHTEAALQN